MALDVADAHPGYGCCRRPDDRSGLGVFRSRWRGNACSVEPIWTETCELADIGQSTWGGPMDDMPYLRRQAALCLDLSRSCSDVQVAEHLHLMAAEFHAQALRAEFKAKLDSDLSADPFD